jgi:hypothetical protein
VVTLVVRNVNKVVMGSGRVCVWWDFKVWSQEVDFVLLRFVGIWPQSPWRRIHI